MKLTTKTQTLIRHYAANDLESVVCLFQRSVREAANRDYSPAQIAVWAPEHPDLIAWSTRLASCHVLIAEQNEEIVGFIGIDCSGHIDLLFVHPNRQRQGIARSLYERAITWSLIQGATQLTSEVSLTARPFFERMGFSLLKIQEIERQGIRLQNFFMARAK